MGELIFMGLGLSGIKDISLKGFEILKSADYIFIELYTSIIPGFSIERFEKLINRKIRRVYRRDLEDLSGKEILSLAEKHRVVLLVPGDPFIATTHNSIRLMAIDRGISIKTIHASSIISAIYGSIGLHCYKFGKIVTIVFPDERYGYFPETPYHVLHQNLSNNLHTLFLLDIRVDEKKYMTIGEAIKILLELENKIGGKIISLKTIGIGVARIGSEDEKIVCNTLGKLLEMDFGQPPYSLIIPGKLHPMEIESLIKLAGADKRLFGGEYGGKNIA